MSDAITFPCGDPTVCHYTRSLNNGWDAQTTHECTRCGATFFFGSALQGWDVMSPPTRGVQGNDTADAILRDLVASCDALDASLLNFTGDDDEAANERHRLAWERAKAYVAGVPGNRERLTEDGNA